MLDGGDLIKAARSCAKSDSIVFVGIGGSGIAARDAALRFSQLDVRAEAYSDPYEIVSRSLRMTKADVMIGISHSGRSAVTVDGVASAAGNGALTIGLSNCMNSPLHDVSDILLCTSFPESRAAVAGLSSGIARMCVIDSLYLLAARHRNVALDKAAQIEEHAQERLRLPAR